MTFSSGWLVDSKISGVVNEEVDDVLNGVLDDIVFNVRTQVVLERVGDAAVFDKLKIVQKKRPS